MKVIHNRDIRSGHRFIVRLKPLPPEERYGRYFTVYRYKTNWGEFITTDAERMQKLGYNYWSALREIERQMNLMDD